MKTTPDLATRFPHGYSEAFTLVEVLVSAAIAAVILAAIYESVSLSFNSLTATRQNLRATQIMVSHLEGLRLESWGTGPVSGTNSSTQLFNTNYVPPTFTDDFYPLGLNGTTNGGITYYGTVTVSPLTNVTEQAQVFGSNTIPSYASNMALVTVTLVWTNSTTGAAGQGTSHARTMSTLVAEYGIQNYVFSASQ